MGLRGPSDSPYRQVVCVRVLTRAGENVWIHRILGCEPNIVGGRSDELGAFRIRERPLDPGGGADGQSTGGDLGPFAHKGASGDKGSRAYHRSVHDDGSHTDERAIFDRAPMKNGTMADRDVVANERGILTGRDMDYGIVLKIGSSSDADIVDIAPNDGSEPDRRFRPKVDISDDVGVRRDKAILSDGRQDASIGECGHCSGSPKLPYTLERTSQTLSGGKTMGLRIRRRCF